MSKEYWNINREKLSDLACTIAKDLFEMGSEPSRGDAGIVHRIAFKAGDYPDGETELGGLCEESLARRIDASLKAAGVC